MVFILLTGLISRFALAPIAGHPYDMAIWANYQRLFYSSGTIDFRYFPTLPVIYYFQLAAYSFYVLLVNLGLSDPVIFYHTTYAIEGVFLKLPMIFADIGVFFLFARVSNIRAAGLYFLNPFMIYLSAAWGTYDSIMIFYLVAGCLALERNRTLLATTSFTLSGLVKLFGIVPLTLVLLESIVRRRFKTLFLQLAIFGLASLVVLSPIALQGGTQNFFSGFALRFIGLSGAQTRTYSVLSAIEGVRYGGAPPYLLGAFLAVPIGFVLKVRKEVTSHLPILQFSLIGAILLNILSQSEPQWLSWTIPLALIYASATKREGLGFFAFAFGLVASFLSITLTQGSGYILFGLPRSFYFEPLEGFTGSIAVYAITMLFLLLLMTGYVLLRPVRFRFEVLGLILIIYCQAFFWFSIGG